MDFGIHDKVAFVAAASRGLGKAVALQLSREGAKVVICSRNEKSIRKAAENITSQTGNEVRGYACDVTNEDEVKKLFGQVIDDLGSLDILVTNAGGPPAGMAVDFGPDDYRNGVELNLMSTISMVCTALPQMKQNKWGRIVAIASIAARQPVPQLILSNTARAGLLGFLKSLSAQVATDGITVNSVCPGYTRTERIDELAEMFVESGKGTKEDFFHNIEVEVPMQRMGTPEEFANAVAFLASERASYITGVNLAIDGGYIKGIN
jgi:3-oxoacyl-[acyl-carrier protein] reductase